MSNLTRSTASTLEQPLPRREQLLLEGFLLSKRNPNTRAAYRRDLLDFHSWLLSLKPDAQLVEVSRPVLDLYSEHLTHRVRFSEATSARKLAAVSSFYRYLVREKQLSANPAAAVERPKAPSDSPRTGLTRAEARALIHAAQLEGATASALIAALLYRGLRISEALQLDAGRFAKEGTELSTQLKRKGGRAQRVSFPAEAAELLSAALKRGAGPLIRGPRGGALTRQSASRLVAALGRKIQLGRPLCPHDLRHAAITNLLDAGGSLAEAQDFAGHASPLTTRRYDRHRRADTGAAKLAAYLAS
jgi:site-specific recombinase XerD